MSWERGTILVQNSQTATKKKQIQIEKISRRIPSYCNILKTMTEEGIEWNLFNSISQRLIHNPSICHISANITCLKIFPKRVTPIMLVQSFTKLINSRPKPIYKKLYRNMLMKDTNFVTHISSELKR